MREEGTTSDVDTLYWMREAELKHGRVAQLAGRRILFVAYCDDQLSINPPDEPSDGIAGLVLQFATGCSVILRYHDASPLRLATGVYLYNYYTVVLSTWYGTLGVYLLGLLQFSTRTIRLFVWKYKYPRQ